MSQSTTAAEPASGGAPGPGDEVDAPPPPEDPTPSRGRFRGLLHATLPGCWGAVLFAALSFTPSLLPRGGFIQGLVCGITASIGYGLGVLAAWLWRAFADREPRQARPRSWRVLLVGGGLVLVVAFALGQYWQHQIRALMGVTEYNLALVVISPFVAVFFFALFVLIGRGIRRVYHWVAELLSRRFGKRAASATGWVLVTATVYLVISGILLDGLVSAMDEAFSVRNGITEEGVAQPTSSLRSGGPGSVVPWDTLGREGRTFAASGPSASDITAVVGRPAEEPIRTYAGLDSGDDAEARAALAVEDLARAGGFERKNLLVATTTGSGWVDPALVAPFEYLSDGDAATVSMQYSYLPSWLSFLVDQTKAREAGRALFDAVYDRWSKLPQDKRPRLFVAGESLGTFGGETAFSGEYDLRNRTAGTVFAGPPNFNTLFRDFSDHRDPGSPEIEPVYKNGRTVRFATDAATSIPPAGQPWDGTRVIYLMHPSDPIVWWSPNLIFTEPDWIGEPPGRDVLEGMLWMPFITFWQVTADLPFSTGVPAGHGHKYTTEYVDAWNAVMRPEGISAEQLARIRSATAALG
ncbi:putative membrane protein [Humibacillus xanthopallidus]|uniref:Putative membrane protein n=1 Tax=Humibacillus xanthopallidus TaxID=412689 RepID=A0A543PR88_9MICO|nr:alpha/beta-hydrolase family protein [Humibacillus xanthopallidus]TQN46587.1 putative membrane protein [Humibacillus xanthopallidus]